MMCVVCLACASLSAREFIHESPINDVVWVCVTFLQFPHTLLCLCCVVFCTFSAQDIHLMTMHACKLWRLYLPVYFIVIFFDIVV
jgi:hypothetical protein